MRDLWRRFLVWFFCVWQGIPRKVYKSKPKLLAPPSSPIPNVSIEEALQDTDMRLEAIAYLIDNPDQRSDDADLHALGQELMYLTRELRDMRSYLNASRS